MRSLALPGLLLLAACLAILALGELRREVPAFLALSAAAGAFYLWAVRLVLSGRFKGSLALIITLALLMRAALFLSPPSLSDDIFRYHWDGRLMLSGMNPYSHAPAAPKLSAHRDALWPGINHKEIPTIYPPLMQVAFALGEASGLGPICGHKLLYLACDLLLIWLLVAILKRRGLPPERLLIYAWSPLVIIETAGSAHNDALPALLLLGSLACLERRRDVASTALLAASALAKLYTIWLLPVHWRGLRRKPLILLLPLLMLAAYLPFAGAGWGLLGGLSTYARHWQFNGSIFWLLSEMLPQDTARLIAALLLMLAVVWVSRREDDPLRAAFLSLGALLMLSPTVHPWYLLWVAPFLCLYPVRAWLLLTALTPLSYAVLIGYVEKGIWQESLAVKALIWLPFYLLLAWDFRGARVLATTSPRSRS